MRLFFDVDGVLIDGWHSRPERRRPWDLHLERDLGVEREAFSRALFAPGPDGGPSLMQACSLGRLDLLAVLADVLPSLGFHRPAEDFAAYWFTRDSVIDEAVLSIARQLGRRPGLALYLATNQEHHRAAWLWDGLGFRNDFRDLFHTARLGLLKSDPAFFAAIDAELGPPEVQPLLFDDSEAACAAARLAGWEACRFDGLDDLRHHPRIAPLLRQEAP